MTLLTLEDKIINDFVFLDKNDIKLALMHVFGIKTYSEFVMKGNELVSLKPEINGIINRLSKGEPIQYILGYAYFYDRDFKVNKNVLIPRPETEELVDIVIKETKDNPGVLVDVGTGSGVIAITIKSHTKHFVFATDISKKALKIARENDIDNSVNFKHGDLLSQIIKDGLNVNYIVANLPYIKKEEKLESKVVNYEPKKALFLPAKNIFERLFAQVDKLPVVKGGITIFLEFGTNQGQEIKEMALKKIGDSVKIEIRRDMQGRERFLIIKGVNGNKSI